MADPVRSRIPPWFGDLRGASLAFLIEVLIVIAAVAFAVGFAAAALALF